MKKLILNLITITIFLTAGRTGTCDSYMVGFTGCSLKGGTEMLELVDKYNKEMPQDIRDWLENERGIARKVIDEFSIGWNGKALTIPIKDREGAYSFFKFRKHPKDVSDAPKYWYSPGGSSELYGWEHLTNPKPVLLICEGELDRLKAESEGIPAVSGTSGAATFKEEWIDVINNIPSDVYIAFDNDNLSGSAEADTSAAVCCAEPSVKLVNRKTMVTRNIFFILV